MHAIHIPTDMEEMFQFIANKTGRSLDDLIQDALDHFLVEWEDQQDAIEADRLYREFKESGEKGIPWEQVKAKLDAGKQ
ncbi:MAG: hypothetical protein H7833_10540 [Magnetococcus sp. DMHC-1]